MLWIPVIVLYGAVGLALVIGPCLFLVFSARSPLRSSDAGYVHGFGLGIAFVFFVLLGLVFVGVAFKRFRLSFGGQPAH